MRVAHDAQDVPEGVDHRGGDEPPAAFRERFALFGSHGQQLLEGRRHVVDVPVRDGAGRSGPRPFGSVAAVDQAQFVLVVADAELSVPRALEVRGDAQQLRVPSLRSLQVVRLEIDGGQSPQHSCPFPSCHSRTPMLPEPSPLPTPILPRGWRYPRQKSGRFRHYQTDERASSADGGCTDRTPASRPGYVPPYVPRLKAKFLPPITMRAPLLRPEIRRAFPHHLRPEQQIKNSGQDKKQKEQDSDPGTRLLAANEGKRVLATGLQNMSGARGNPLPPLQPARARGPPRYRTP